MQDHNAWPRIPHPPRADTRSTLHLYGQIVGKVSPSHLFWGSFDLAVTRFSGWEAPRHPGGIPNLPDTVTQEASSHEVSSAGLWPGGGAVAWNASQALPASRA